MKKLLVVLSLLVCSNTDAQIISTTAGNYASGYTGDGGPATAARVYAPRGIAKDSYGNLYVAEAWQHIRKVDIAGIITTIAGTSGGFSGDGGLAVSAQFNDPRDIVIDNRDNIYIADMSNNRIRKISASGIITTVAGNGSTAFSGDGGPATAAGLYEPTGVAIDAAGNLYISEKGNHCIRKVNLSGIISTVAGRGADRGYSGDGGAATAAQLNSPMDVALDDAGNIFIADMSNYRIRKINTSGIISTIAGSGSSGSGGDGGPATAATINSASGGGICLDKNGNLYIMDYFNHRVRRVDLTSGIISTLAGGGSSVPGDGGPATAASVGAPLYGFVDKNQNLFFGSVANAVRKVKVPSYANSNFSVMIDDYCHGPEITIAVPSYSSGMYIKTFFGDGTSDSTSMSGILSPTISHNYVASGNFSIRHILFNGGVRVDSIRHTFAHTSCYSFPVNVFYDDNGNCVKDASETANLHPVGIEVDSNGVVIDTIYNTSGLYYNVYGRPGDVYQFRIISLPLGSHVLCPSSGVIRDTITASVYTQAAVSFALQCSTGSAFDLSVHPIVLGTGARAQLVMLLAQNYYCNDIPAVITATYSPKYNGTPAIYPASASSVGNTLNWNLTALSDVRCFTYRAKYSGTPLTIGDTVHSTFAITPASGDTDPGNNYAALIDTVRAGFDPNAIYVKPGGCIASGAAPTQLQYTITFENTGNDTAHNIYVMDTLPGYVDVSTLRIVTASHEMYTSKLKDASGHTILKFDFPNIKLLDSSHHGLCDGAVIYTIKTKPGLATGTDIMNRVGIYFDVNEVVMTNEAHNVIGCPPAGVGSPDSYRESAVGSPLVYPNPASEVLNIDADQWAFEAFVITNNLGSVVASGNIARANTVVNIKSLPAGMYFVSLSGVAGKTVMRFVKE